MREGIQHLYQVFLNCLFPKKCLVCKQIFDVYVCENCRHKVFLREEETYAAGDIDVLYVGYYYTSKLRSLMHTFKYEYIQGLGKHFAEGFRDEDLLNTKIDCIIPVPLHYKKLCQRGFNQSEIIAQEISKKIEIPVQNILLRNRKTKQQALLNRKMREKNVHKAFTLKTQGEITSVLLIDDVYTTGATLQECARILKQSGVQTVYAYVVYKKDIL